MTFILGVCGFGPSAPVKGSVDPMIAAQEALAPDGVVVRQAGSAVFARGLYRLSDEDVFDDQPYLFSDRPGAMAADARIDNREELLDRLGLNRGSRISDPELLFQTYRNFGEQTVNLIVGDFAFAVWDEDRRELVLARDFSGQRPLHFHLGDGFVAFASMPHALLAHERISVEPDTRQMAEFLADIPRSGDRTYFRSIRRVQPGHVVRIDPGGIRTRPYWHVPERRLQYRDHDQYALALRESLERATAARVRGASGVVGAHLSAGLDSSAVATTAALLMREQEGRVVAFTSAPRSGFDGPMPRGRIADESAIAACAAALHSNMDHVVVRAEGTSPLDIIRRDSGIFGEPLGLPCNQVWWAAVNDCARDRGISILLTGEAGNHAFSSGGLPTLAEFVSDGCWRRLLHEARILHGKGVRWRGIAGSAFGPWIPELLWMTMQRLTWGRSTGREGASLLGAQAQAELPQDAAVQSRNRRPSRDPRKVRAALLQGGDPGVFRKGTLARWGLDERDPTTDQRLVEYCLAIPPEHLLRNGVTRALARTAFADRLPPEILDGPRGYQGADWYERVDESAICQALDDLGQRLESKEIVDLGAIRNLASSWPGSGWDRGSVISPYRYALLRAVSAAYFLASFKPVVADRSLRRSPAAFTGAA